MRGPPGAREQAPIGCRRAVQVFRPVLLTRAVAFIQVEAVTQAEAVSRAEAAVDTVGAATKVMADNRCYGLSAQEASA